eukprot:GHVU01212333.1.p2 GENE.GHVU01212333.1~~GHVU01212333.1.p2  ORF type:complete len:102 (-),score=6.54 GHVU01212333.1:46-351(-)
MHTGHGRLGSMECMLPACLPACLVSTCPIHMPSNLPACLRAPCSLLLYITSTTQQNILSSRNLTQGDRSSNWGPSRHLLTANTPPYAASCIANTPPYAAAA